MRMRTDVKYWINYLEGNNDKVQPQSKEEEIACQIAEYFVLRKKENIAA